MGFLSRLIGKLGKHTGENTVARGSERGKHHGQGEVPNNINLDSIEYIPLPQSPCTWELDGRDGFQREYEDPLLKEIFQYGWQGKYTKVINLSKKLSIDRLSGQLGQIVAKAYRNTVLKRLRANQIKSAARWAKEMLDTVPTHCTDTDKRRLNKIILKLDKAKIKHKFLPVDVPPPSSEPLFTLSKGDKWNILEVKTLPKDERPDKTFQILGVTFDGVLYADRNGKSELASGGPSALRKLDRSGKVVAERAINHDIYRVGFKATSKYCIIMDSNGCIYIYDNFLKLIAKSDLQEDRRVKEHFRTTDTNYWGEFRSQVRAVDASTDGRYYLFTLADEAWCCSLDGETVWGVRMPLNEGWVRAVGQSAQPDLGIEVEEALKTLGLTLPITPQEIKQKYKKLALRHHPDRNPGDTEADKRMQEINEAFQILTGIDPAKIDIVVEDSETTYFRRETPDHVIESGSIRLEFWGLSGPAQDWIYCASFLAHSTGAFLLTYSGKVVEVDSKGLPLRVYDIGVVPDEIVEVGNYIYILTSTRLYVLEQKNNLIAFVDVFRKGRLLVTTTGFGLLDSKCFKWFTPSGDQSGEVITRHPIRALYNSEYGIVIETRQHRTTISGLSLFDSTKH
ncbi:MAG: J domain-containing protein [Deltaproteobacteria bacterium]